MSGVGRWWRARRAALDVQWARVRAYRTAVALVLGECLRHFKWPLSLSVVLGVIGLGAQFGALALILYVVRHFERDQPATFHTALFDFVLSADQRLVWRAGQRVGLLLPRAVSREQLLPLINVIHVPGGGARIGFVDYRLVELLGDVQPAHSSRAVLAAPAQLVVASALAEVDAPAAVVIQRGPLASFSAGSLARLDALLLVRADGRLTRLDAEWAESHRKEVKLLLAEAKAAATQGLAAKGGAALSLDEDLL